MADRRQVLHEAAEHGGPFVFIARVNFYRAVYGDTPPPIGKPEGKTSVGKAEPGAGSVNEKPSIFVTQREGNQTPTFSI
jgi:hypothetical protein